MQALTARFEQQHAGITFRSNYASSAQLAIQLTQGARADLFASADYEQMTSALAQVPTASQPIPFASNQLALLVPDGNPAGIHDLLDLAQPSTRLVLAVPGTPLRNYSDQLLERLVNQSTNGDELRNQIMENLVSEEENARQVVAKIALGEADAAFVYRSDVQSQIAQDSLQIDIPNEVQVEVRYPLVNLAEGNQQLWTEQFIQFILSPAGQEILMNWGFGPKPAP